MQATPTAAQLSRAKSDLTGCVMHDLALIGRAVTQKNGEEQHGPSALGHKATVAVTFKFNE